MVHLVDDAGLEAGRPKQGTDAFEAPLIANGHQRTLDIEFFTVSCFVFMMLEIAV